MSRRLPVLLALAILELPAAAHQNPALDSLIARAGSDAVLTAAPETSARPLPELEEKLSDFFNPESPQRLSAASWLLSATGNPDDWRGLPASIELRLSAALRPYHAALVEVLKSESNAEIVKGAANMLGLLGSASAAALVEARLRPFKPSGRLGFDEYEPHRTIERNINRKNVLPAALPLLEEGLRSPDVKRRFHAAVVIESASYSFARQVLTIVPQLILTLRNDDEPVIRALMAKTFDRIYFKTNETPGLADVVAALNDRDPYVRQAAAYALYFLAYNPFRDKKVPQEALDARPTLVRMYIWEPGDDSVRNTAWSAAKELGLSADVALTHALAALEDPEWFVRMRGAVVLRTLGAQAKPALPKLFVLFGSDPNQWVRDAAKYAIKAIDPDPLR